PFGRRPLVAPRASAPRLEARRTASGEVDPVRTGADRTGCYTAGRADGCDLRSSRPHRRGPARALPLPLWWHVRARARRGPCHFRLAPVRRRPSSMVGEPGTALRRLGARRVLPALPTEEPGRVLVPAGRRGGACGRRTRASTDGGGVRTVGAVATRVGTRLGPRRARARPR